MSKIKVRFNLGRGKNYLKWKIESKSGVEYHYPADVQLILHNCILKNNRKTAEKIFNGMNKDVCAWVLCESITIKHKDNVNSYHDFEKVWVKDKLSYNPRKQPYWVYNGFEADNEKFEKIVSVDYGLYGLKK